MRKMQFTTGEHYHVFNRGVDKREIFTDNYDLERLLQSIEEFNNTTPIGSIYENSFRKKQLGSRASKSGKLVSIICYCINPNHFHFLLRQLEDDGISKFMHRFGTGYTKHFNKKYERSGALFQGAFKAVHIDTNEYLLHLSAYINLNDRVHRLGSSASKSSWDEYIGEEGGRCDTDIVLNQFENSSEYRSFAEKVLDFTLEKRADVESLLLE